MATATRIAQIVSTPGVRGGKARVEGTRICVLDVVYFHKASKTPEEICGAYPELTLAQVYSALSYYYDHTDEIEASMARDVAWEEGAERRWQELVARNGGRPPEKPTPEEKAIPRPFPSSPEE